MNEAYCFTLMMSTNLGLRNAPPTRKHPHRLAWQLLAGCPIHINDAGCLSHCIRDIEPKPSPELSVYSLGLLGSCSLACTNGLHRLRGQKNLVPVLHVIRNDLGLLKIDILMMSAFLSSSFSPV